MKEKLQKLLELLQKRADKAEQRMYDLEPRFEDGEREAFENTITGKVSRIVQNRLQAKLKPYYNAIFF